MPYFSLKRPQMSEYFTQNQQGKVVEMAQANFFATRTAHGPEPLAQ